MLLEISTKQLGDYFMKNAIIIVGFVFLCILANTYAFAHTMWINVSDHNPQYYKKFGAGTKAYIGWGHNYPVDDFLEHSALKEFKLIDPEGKTKELKPNPGGFLATEIRVKHKGTFLVSAVKNPGFYTMYKKNGQIHHKSTPKNAIKADIEEVVLSHYFEESAKSLINVGQADVKRLKQPLGHTLEILCLKNPRELKVGEMLPIKVLFKEKPAQFVQVLATYSSFSTEDDFAFATKTNQKGEARIKILHQGNWLIKAWKKMPAIAEYRNKCNQMSYSATFTFSIE